MENQINNIMNSANLQIFVALSQVKQIKTEYQVIASTFFISLKHTSSIKLEDMVSRMEKLGWTKLIIIRVNDEAIEIKNVKLSSSILVDINIISIPTKEFFTEKWMNYFILNNQMQSHNIIYNFCGIKWQEVLTWFKWNNIIISGGSTTKRHILSPVQLRLGQFVTIAFGMNKSNAIESFHLANEKNLTRPIHDLTKRENNLLFDEYKEKIRMEDTDIEKDKEVNKQFISSEKSITDEIEEIFQSSSPNHSSISSIKTGTS